MHLRLKRRNRAGQIFGRGLRCAQGHEKLVVREPIQAPFEREGLTDDRDTRPGNAQGDQDTNREENVRRRYAADSELPPELDLDSGFVSLFVSDFDSDFGSDFASDLDSVFDSALRESVM